MGCVRMQISADRQECVIKMGTALVLSPQGPSQGLKNKKKRDMAQKIMLLQHMGLSKLKVSALYKFSCLVSHFTLGL